MVNSDMDNTIPYEQLENTPLAPMVDSDMNSTLSAEQPVPPWDPMADSNANDIPAAERPNEATTPIVPRTSMNSKESAPGNENIDLYLDVWPSEEVFPNPESASEPGLIRDPIETIENANWGPLFQPSYVTRTGRQSRPVNRMDL
jgi:hypothetical protein